MDPKPSDTQALPVVAVVGGGASGVLAAIRLLGSEAGRTGKIRVVVVERESTLGRGVAFGTDIPHHLLNVRKEHISAYAEDSGHFVRWAAGAVPAEAPRDYLPRSAYAAYLASLLNELVAGVPSGTFQSIRGEVGNFTDDGKRLVLHLADGTKISCDRLVIATGLRAPRLPEGFRKIRSRDRLIEDPWDTVATSRIENAESILVIGSGLTAVDFVLNRIRGGQKTVIEALSRHGYSPQPHLVIARNWEIPEKFPDGSVREVLRFLREEGTREGVAWPDVVDRFRHEVHRIWLSWDASERGRFLRHLHSTWDNHRHRISPEVFREWEEYRKSGKIRLSAGRIISAVEEKDGIQVEIRKRSGSLESKRFERIVNCTGTRPETSLLEGHGYRTDPLGIGWPTDAEGRPLRTDGRSDPRVFVLGAALRTYYWEMTAVPDLRVQAKRLADALLAGLR